MGISVGRMGVWILRRLGILGPMFRTVRQHPLVSDEYQGLERRLTFTTSRPSCRFLRACSLEAAIRLVDALAIVICTRYNMQSRKEVEVSTLV
jgi:hypothetical protein